MFGDLEPRRERQELDRILRQASRELYKDELRIDGGYKLALQATGRAMMLNRLITQGTADNPGLELICRGFELAAAIGAEGVIREHYLRRW